MGKFSTSVTEAEHRRLSEFIDALRTPCDSCANPASDLASEAFENEFRTKLLTHHCFIGSPLFQESFDSAFVSACVQAGHVVEEAPSGQRFWDLVVDGKRISLKSSKAKNLRPGKLHISKLTEAAWIQDCRTASKRCARTRQLFHDYCQEVDIIIQLRFFCARKLYELVEVPVSLFAQVEKVGATHYRADGPTINIPIGAGTPNFTLKLDRSDSKVTIANIDKDLCLVHGTWQL